MPGPALHLALAETIYARWASAPLSAPFEPCARTRNAFLHGALGPDAGYFPGGDPLLATLAHHARTGEFCRALVAEAERDEEEAFAWGWVTHVLADVAIHPLVNDACGELRTGTRTALWGEAVAREHLRVEMGLDAAVGAPPERMRLAPARAEALGGVARAYRRTFGAGPAAERIVAAHRHVAPLLGMLAWWSALARRAAPPEGRGCPLAAAALHLLGSACPAGSEARALFSPVAPPPWLRAEVEEIRAGFPDWFDAHFASGLRFLRNHCLDTGDVAEADPPRAVRAMSALRAA